MITINAEIGSVVNWLDGGKISKPATVEVRARDTHTLVVDTSRHERPEDWLHVCATRITRINGVRVSHAAGFQFIARREV